jgi:hypothetical protein
MLHSRICGYQYATKINILNEIDAKLSFANTPTYRNFTLDKDGNQRSLHLWHQRCAMLIKIEKGRVKALYGHHVIGSNKYSGLK